jgi:hypothetical protein
MNFSGPGPELAEAFEMFDRARLAHSDPQTRAAQLSARQILYDYVEELWNDVERAGEQPSVGEKYRAIASVRRFVTALRATAFEAVHGSEGEARSPS